MPASRLRGVTAMPASIMCIVSPPGCDKTVFVEVRKLLFQCFEYVT